MRPGWGSVWWMRAGLMRVACDGAWCGLGGLRDRRGQAADEEFGHDEIGYPACPGNDTIGVEKGRGEQHRADGQVNAKGHGGKGEGIIADHPPAVMDNIEA